MKTVCLSVNDLIQQMKHEALRQGTKLTLELGERFSQHPQLFALLLHVLLRHQAVVHRRVPLQLLHRLLQVAEEQQVQVNTQLNDQSR